MEFGNIKLNGLMGQALDSNNIMLKIFDDINIAISVVDENLITRFWNKSAEKMYEISREKVLNRPITEFFPNALLQKVIKEGKAYKNVYNSPRDNCHNIISATPIFDNGKVVGGIGYDKDVSELMRLSELLNKTQTNLELLEKETTRINESKYSFSKVIGNSQKFQQAINLAKSVAQSNISILLTGESGTGKEVFTRAIHLESNRSGYFIPINCSAIPEELMESELFGYEGGAFTGASKEGKIGKFELANNGTLFLDEIAELPLSMQPKILRVLDDGIITRVGGQVWTKVDVRVIAATNKDIKKMVDEGTFRKDLFYRLNSAQILLPPLRERKDDIPALVEEFVKEICIENKTNIKEIDPKLMLKLIDHKWEGNIRELKNIIEIMVILAKYNNIDILDIHLLPENIFTNSESDNIIEHMNTLDINIITENAEKEAIKKALSIAKGNKSQAANLLNIPRSTLYFKLDKYGISF